MKPKVVHCKKAKPGTFIYVGRPTKWGNKFSHKDNTLADYICSSREEAIQKYKEWLMQDEQRNFRQEIKEELAGFNLGCWCAPLACHADILLKIANVRL